MWHAFVKKEGRHVLGLLLSENADEEAELLTWGSRKGQEKADYNDFSGAVDWIRSKRPALIHVVDPGGWGRFAIPDMDVMISPE